jgi:hypothetical protein
LPQTCASGKWSPETLAAQGIVQVKDKGGYFRRGATFQKNGPLTIVRAHKRKRPDGSVSSVHSHLRTSEPRNLYLSFTSLLHAMSRGKVTTRDLNRGLFYFGATQLYLLSPAAEEYRWAFGHDVAAASRAHETLKAALRRAEASGRVAWRPVGEPNTFDQLNALLARSGYRTVDPEAAEQAFYGVRYSYPTAERAIRSAGLRLKTQY